MIRTAICLIVWLPLCCATTTASQDATAREPGVIVRLYDIGVDARYLAELAPNQLPNFVRVTGTIELRSDRGDFAPLADRFMTEVLGDLRVERPGTYAFRLISDDGARLWIDKQLVIDHDGLHGATPKDGKLELAAGVHALRIVHFDNLGDKHLELRWKPAGSPENADFVLIPASALSHSRDVPRETSPGTKKIIPPLRRGRPGDGTPVAGTHPSFKFEPALIRPETKLAQMLSDGQLRLMGREQARGPEPVVAWLPRDVGPGTDVLPVRIASGPYRGQLILWSSPGVESKRVFFDVRGAQSQGCVFRFSAGGPSALQPTGEVPLEMLAVRALSNGLEIEFTKPLDPRCGWDADSYYIEQWPFAPAEPGASATGQPAAPGASATGQPPRRDGIRYPVKSASVSPDRRRVFLEVENLKPLHVVYIRLLPPCVSEDGELPWSTEAWYTLNVIPQDRYGKVLAPPKAEPQNLLTEAEQAAGWKLLFDGKTTAGWRGYKQERFPEQGWQVIDGCMVRVAPGGDICTVEEFDDFELKLEWRISAGGNSGIFYRVGEEYGWPWESGPEMQVLDNAEHADGRNPKTSAGSNYALYAPVRDVTRPVGFFNQVRIVADGPHIQHWLNGVKVVEYELGSDEWQELVAGSKFAAWPNYGRVPQGHIVLQDHGDQVWYRNIKIRRLGRD